MYSSQLAQHYSQLTPLVYRHFTICPHLLFQLFSTIFTRHQSFTSPIGKLPYFLSINHTFPQSLCLDCSLCLEYPTLCHVSKNDSSSLICIPWAATLHILLLSQRRIPPGPAKTLQKDKEFPWVETPSLLVFCTPLSCTLLLPLGQWLLCPWAEHLEGKDV